MSVVNAVSADSDQSLFPDVTALLDEQKNNPKLAAMLHYIQEGTLPDSEKSAQRMVAKNEQYDIINGVLHFENSHFLNHCCIVVSEWLRPEVLREAHAGCFAGHLAEKVYDHLRRSVWWKGMKADVRRHC